MEPARLGAVTLFVVARLVETLAQTADFSGTWQLDVGRSRLAENTALVGLIPSGAPAALHISQASNGTVMVESRINESHARMYKPGGKSSTPAGQGGSITMTSRWENGALVSEGSQDSPTGASIAVKEVLALSADGRTLTFDVTTSAAAEKSSLVYTRTQTVEPCEKWPAPCKRPSP